MIDDDENDDPWLNAGQDAPVISPPALGQSSPSHSDPTHSGASQPNPTGNQIDFAASADEMLKQSAHLRPDLQNLRQSWFDGLNISQREAVEAVEGPLLVLAGAGTGKTKVLTTRLANILASGLAWEGQILCVTFTNKAAREMRERIETLLGHNVERMWIGTFHALAARILRKYGDRLGYGRDFSILDQDDQLRLIKEIARNQGVENKHWPAGALSHHIQRWKDRALFPEDVGQGEYQALKGSKLADIYPLYQSELMRLNAMDFGDLLLQNIRLFRQHQDVYDEYRKRFRFLLVDEYQDTNIAQYLWLRLLAKPFEQNARANICCVGDDDQSIYGWRGAEVGNILKFEQDFDGAQIVRLECNYRSTAPILAAASGLIAHNQGRLGKTLWTAQKGGENVFIRPSLDDYDEAHYVASTAQDEIRKGDFRADDIAVLVRASYQTRPFEERFIACGLPYRVVGGLRFYEREETRDAIAWLRLVRAPKDDLALMRIVTKPARGIGATSLERIRAYAQRQGISILEAAQIQLDEGEVKGTAKKGLSLLIADLERWRLLGQQAHDQNSPDDKGAGDDKMAGHVALARLVLEESGYFNLWRQSNKPDAKGRLENLEELLAAMERFPDLSSFLDHVSLVMENEDNPNAGPSGQISIMTLHAAKGLEFDLVYLPGWEEDIFPNPRALAENDRDGLEEERRLAYVGLTRARKRAVILYAASRLQYGERKTNSPSRFLKELPADQITMIKSAPASRYTQNYGGAYNRANQQRIYGQRGYSQAGNYGGPSRSRRNMLMPGDRCHHEKFGEGVVLKTDGQHVSVIFESGGRERMILAEFLTPLAD